MTAQFTIKGIPQLMKNLGGYEQVAVRTMGKIVFQEGETVMAECNYKCVGSSQSAAMGAIRSM